MRRSLSVCLALAMALSVLPGATAFAQDASLTSCSGDNISGTVVAVDSDTGLVTIQQADSSLCTVSLNATYDQPIVGLLGDYFENVTPESLSAALTSLQTQLDCSTSPCALSADGGTDATVQSVTDNGDGTYTVVFLVDDGFGGTTTQTVLVDDATVAQQWMDALNNLTVDWTLTTDDSGQAFYSGTADQIASMHDDGMGFGVIVKLYAMAAQAEEACAAMDGSTTTDSGSFDPCAVSVQSLADAFNSGTGMGQLFKEYGKPDKLGVGHIRNGLPGQNPNKGTHGNSDKPCNPHANSHSDRSCSSGE